MKNSLHRPVLRSRITHITTATCGYLLSFSVKICVICAGFFFLPFSSFSQNTKSSGERSRTTDSSTVVLTKLDSLLQVLKTLSSPSPEFIPTKEDGAGVGLDTNNVLRQTKSLQ